MCCEAGHLGAPPEWHKEQADQVISEGRAVPLAQTAAWWRRRFAPPGPGPRPASTEGGAGRALPTWPWQGDRVRQDDWAAEFRRADPGGMDSAWARRWRDG